MGRILSRINAQNLLDPTKKIELDALVDTGAAYLTLPMAWKASLGELEKIRDIEAELANQELIRGEVYAPVRLKIGNFPPVVTEVLFIPMEPVEGEFEPLLGYIPLEQAGIAVDMLGHRLIHVKRADLK